MVLAKLAPPQPKQYPSFTNTKDSHSQNPEIEIRCYMEQLFLRMSGRSTSLIAGLISSLCLGRKLFWNTRGTMPAQLTSLYMENLAGILPHGFTTCRTMCLLSFVSCDEVSCWSSAISQNDEKMLRKYNLSFEIMCIQVFDFPVLKSRFFTWTTESTSSTSTIWWLTSCKFSFWVQKHLTASLSAGMDGQVVWMADGAFGACLALYRRQRYWRPLCYAMVFQFPWCRLRWEVQQGAGYRVFVSFPSVKCQDVSWSFMLFHVAAVGFWRLLWGATPPRTSLPSGFQNALATASLWLDFGHASGFWALGHLEGLCQKAGDSSCQWLSPAAQDSPLPGPSSPTSIIPTGGMNSWRWTPTEPIQCCRKSWLSFLVADTASTRCSSTIFTMPSPMRWAHWANVADFMAGRRCMMQP